MDFVAYGLNYKTAPLCIRERIALPVPEQDAFLQHLVRSSYSQEALFYLLVIEQKFMPIPIIPSSLFTL